MMIDARLKAKLLAPLHALTAALQRAALSRQMAQSALENAAASDKEAADLEREIERLLSEGKP